jgi:SAM-dependent methyltransferase
MKSGYGKIKDCLYKVFPFINNGYFRDIWVVGKLQSIPKGKRILDAGAGECKYKKYCSHLIYKSQDFGKYNGKGDGVGLQTRVWDTSSIDIVSDITNIPIEDKSFDYILCTEVLEHIPYPDKAIKEFSRILKQGGRLILTAPFCSQTHFAPFHFCTGFNSYWYEEVLKKEGFKIIELSTNGNYFDYVLQELVRTPLAFKRYSPLGVFSYLLYILILPLVLILFILSKFTKGSEKQMCFGYHVLAEKK